MSEREHGNVKHGLFIRGMKQSPEMRAKIMAGVKRHWDTYRTRSASLMASRKRSDEVTQWVQDELAAVRKTLAERDRR